MWVGVWIHEGDERLYVLRAGTVWLVARCVHVRICIAHSSTCPHRVVLHSSEGEVMKGGEGAGGTITALYSWGHTSFAASRAPELCGDDSLVRLKKLLQNAQGKTNGTCRR